MSFRETWKSLTKGPIGIITYSLLGILLALFVQNVGGLLLDTGLPIVTVVSESMEPNLNVGDIVIIKGYSDYDVGDVIVFDGWRENAIIHRAVMKYDGEDVEIYGSFSQLSSNQIKGSYNGKTIFATKGDNNSQCDQCSGFEFVEIDKVHGKEVFKIPKIGLIKVAAIRLFNLF